MQRITNENLERVISRINITTGHNPEPYSKDENGDWNPCYILDSNGSGVQLEYMGRNGGTGTDVILHRGTKRELYEKLHAFIDGIVIGQKIGTQS